MQVGYIYPGPTGFKVDDQVHHIWMDPEEGRVTAACGIVKPRKRIIVRGQLLGLDDLKRWDAVRKVPFRRCVRCDAWRRKVGEEAVVAESLATERTVIFEEEDDRMCSRGIPLMPPGR